MCVCVHDLTSGFPALSDLSVGLRRQWCHCIQNMMLLCQSSPALTFPQSSKQAGRDTLWGLLASGFSLKTETLISSSHHGEWERSELRWLRQVHRIPRSWLLCTYFSREVTNRSYNTQFVVYIQQRKDSKRIISDQQTFFGLISLHVSFFPL